jgi:hypothetical protein
MIDIRQRTTGTPVLSLERIADDLEDSADLMRGLLGDVLELQQEWWQTDGGGTWAPPSDATLEQDRERGTDPRVMRATGALEKAATADGENVDGREVDFGSDFLRFTVTVPYAEPLANYRGRRKPRGSVQDPTSRDAERYADAYMHQLLRDV